MVIDPQLAALARERPPTKLLFVSEPAIIEHETARLAKHFGCEELRFSGGHLMQLGRGDAFRTIIKRMAGLGLVPPR